MAAAGSDRQQAQACWGDVCRGQFHSVWCSKTVEQHEVAYSPLPTDDDCKTINDDRMTTSLFFLVRRHSCCAGVYVDFFGGVGGGGAKEALSLGDSRMAAFDYEGAITLYSGILLRITLLLHITLLLNITL